MAKAMIVSLGGSPDPVAVTIDHYRPRYVCFMASEQSVDLVAAVKQKVKAAAFRDGKSLVGNVNDLLSCYEAALDAAGKVQKKGFAPEDVVVDYTGGTKSMTAALVLATVAKGYSFSYVGGSKRSKDGLGQVLDGYEDVFEVLNPWEVLAVDEQARLSWLFNHGQFTAALEVLRGVLSKAHHEARLGRVFACLSDVVAGFEGWDRFAHREAAPLLRRGGEGIRGCATLLQERCLLSFADELEASLAFFNRMTQASSGYSRLCQEMVVDLLANAERRALEGRYDDAVARLYRAIEMAAQVALEARKPAIRTGQVQPDQVPASLHSEFVQRYMNREGTALQLPLYASYRLLDALGSPLGARFARVEEAVRGLLAARNGSILAHGLVPIDRAAYEALLDVTLETLDLRSTDLPRFPKLDLGQHPLSGGSSHAST